MSGRAMTLQDHSREVNQLRLQLRSPENQRDPEKYLKYVKRTISYMTQGIDVSSLFSELVIATNTQSMIQRKLVYLFLCNYADSNSELALLVVNTLQKDCHDSNPIVRGLALRSLSSLRIPSLAEYVFPVAKQLMADSSSYVRKISALAAAKISYLAPHLVEEYSIIPSLLHMLRDKDPLVVVGALTALEEIQADAGAPELSSAEVVQLLLARLPTFNEWGMHTVLTALARHFLPRNEDELFDVLNVIDGNLKHTNSGVVLACAKLFILYTENFPELHADVSTRLKDSLVTLMSANCPELIYIINQHLRMLMRRWPALMERDFRVFFLKYNESTFLRCQKIALLAQSATATNYGIIVDELSQYALDPKKSIVTAALNGLGKVATAVPAALDHCLGHLNSLSELEVDDINTGILAVVEELLLQHPDRAEQILSQVSASLEVMASEAARVSLLWIMADFGQFIEGSIVLLDEISRDIGPSTSAELRLAVLSAAMRLFFKDPANMKQILSRILRFEIDAELPLAKADTRDRALFYLRLLHYSPEVAERIVGQPSATGAGQAGKTPADEQFLDFFEFNSLSVVFQRPAVSFTTPLPPFSSMLQRPRSAGPIGRVAGTSAASAPAADPLAGPLLGEAMAPAAGVSAGAGGTGHLLDVMDFSAGGRAGGASASPEDLASQLLGLDFSSATSTSAVALSGSPRSPMDELFGLDTPPTMPAGAAIAAATAPSASSPGTSALTPAALELDSGSFRRAWRQFAQPGQARQVTLPAPGHAGTLSADQLSLLFEAALEEQAKLTTFASGTVAANGALRLLMYGATSSSVADATVVTMELLHVPQSGKVSVTLRAGPAALCFEDAPQTGIATGPVDYDQLLTTIVNDLTRAMQ